MTFTKKFKVHLVMKNMTQRELAKRLEMHYTRLNSYINGKITFPEKTVKKICSVLKIDFEAYKKGRIKEITERR